MNLRTWKAWACAVVAVAVSACTPLKDKCERDADCAANQTCDPAAKVCVGTQVQTGCQPACAQWQQCAGTVCEAKYAGIQIASPVTGAVFDGGTAIPIAA